MALKDWKKNIKNQLCTHRRGIMGTVIFHLLLAIFLLSRGISRIHVHREPEIVIEAPDRKELLEKNEEKRRKEEIRKKSAREEVERMLHSLVANENAPDKNKNHETQIQTYVEEVMAELEQQRGGKYKAQRDKNYSSDSLQNIKDRREQTLDSLKSTFYSGESSVSYDLKDRFARYLPIPVFKCEYGGRVVVEILVNRKGIVQKAIVLENESQQDEQLWQVAREAAERSRFNEKSAAPALQKGKITYHFVKQ